MSAEPVSLLDLITRFKAAEARLSGSGDDDEVERTDFQAAYHALKAAPAATTKEEAIAALRLLLAELEHTEDPDLANALVGAAVAFLDSGSEVTP